MEKQCILNDADKYPQSYPKEWLETQWVHIGFGAFHRAHQALLTDELAKQGKTNWGICEVNLRSQQSLMQTLKAQGYRYSVLEKGAQGNELKIVNIINRALHYKIDGCQAVVEQLAAPAIKLVTLTITEKGYGLDPNTGDLDDNNPVIEHDIAYPDTPQSALGLIVEGLRLRMASGYRAFTVLSCDNIQGNGHMVQKAVLALAQLRSSELAQWITEHVTFPCSMVDRIVPAATDDTLKEIATELGGDDPCGIACEPFIQWVIEDDFVAGRPDWDQVGAEFVADVIPYEEMKLRMLNGSHSFLAYLGYLAGYDTIDEAVADKNFALAAKQLMLNEQAPTLTMPAGTDLAGYAESLLERYRNPNLKHRTWQIAMDGSQKLPQRFLKSASILLQKNTPFPHIALGVAGWMRYISAVDEQGNDIDVRDPMASELKKVSDSATTSRDKVRALLDITSIFGDLGENEHFAQAVQTSYERLIAVGAQQAVAELIV